ncbi:MAG: hypothetical protein NVS1B4_19200 [Gemmatimonadaceae bacterium]
MQTIEDDTLAVVEHATYLDASRVADGLETRPKRFVEGVDLATLGIEDPVELSALLWRQVKLTREPLAHRLTAHGPRCSKPLADDHAIGGEADRAAHDERAQEKSGCELFGSLHGAVSAI